VTIVRTNTGHIFGGYAKVPWSKGSLVSVVTIQDNAATANINL
jgi:hypothetical protein